MILTSFESTLRRKAVSVWEINWWTCCPFLHEIVAAISHLISYHQTLLLSTKNSTGSRHPGAHSVTHVFFQPLHWWHHGPHHPLLWDCLVHRISLSDTIGFHFLDASSIPVPGSKCPLFLEGKATVLSFLNIWFDVVCPDRATHPCSGIVGVQVLEKPLGNVLRGSYSGLPWFQKGGKLCTWQRDCLEVSCTMTTVIVWQECVWPVAHRLHAFQHRHEYSPAHL